jgi:tetratricopeptide (TPR) repeat protein
MNLFQQQKSHLHLQSSSLGGVHRIKTITHSSRVLGYNSQNNYNAGCNLTISPNAVGLMMPLFGIRYQKSTVRHSAVSGDVSSTVPLWMVAEGLEAPVQLVYLTTLLGFLAVGAFVVTRQVLVKRELEEAAKVLGERVRNQEATAEDYYELGVILLRKKLFTQANANLKKSLKNWDEETGDEEIKAQVHNALGYSYFNLDRFEDAIAQYKKAVELQPGYLTAWNNLGDVMEKQKKYREALSAYQEVLGLDPSNVVAKERASYCKTRVDRAQGLL